MRLISITNCDFECKHSLLHMFPVRFSNSLYYKVVQWNPSNVDTIGTTHACLEYGGVCIQGHVSGVLCVSEKAPKAILVTSTIDISENTI